MAAEFRCAAANASLTCHSFHTPKLLSVAAASSPKLESSSSTVAHPATQTRAIGCTLDRPLLSSSTSSHRLPMASSNFLLVRSLRMCDTATLDSPRSSASRDHVSCTWLTNSSYLVNTSSAGTCGATDARSPPKKRFSSSDTGRASSVATQYQIQWMCPPIGSDGAVRSRTKSHTRL